MKRYGATLLLAALATSACGSSSDPSVPTQTVSQPVVGGYVDDADRGAVGLAISLGPWFFGHCSGTLIAPNLVLTARHCVAMTPSQEVVCGQGFGNQGNGDIFRATVETVRPEQDGPEFYKGVGEVRVPPGANDICGFDMALIILEGAGIPANVAEPVIPRIDSTPQQGDLYSAVGYGLTDPNDSNSSGTRMRVDENTVSCRGGLCTGLLGNSVQPTEWMGTAPTCPGDSGGPAFDEQGRVMGVLSRGPQGCLSSVYGDVGSWGEWIIATALEAAQLGGYEPPFWTQTGSSTPEPEPEPEPEPQPELGAECTSTCVGGYLCFDQDNDSQGECVPRCDATAPDCPTSYECTDVSGHSVCVPESALNPATTTTTEGGCSVSQHKDPAKPVPWVLGAVAALGLGLRRRRR